MSYSTKGNNETAESSAFMDAIQSHYNEQNGTGMVLGENGAPAYSMHNMAELRTPNYKVLLLLHIHEIHLPSVYIN